MRRCALLLALCAALPDPAWGQDRSFEVESLRVVIDSAWGSQTAPGYLPVRLDITNLGEARVIELVGQGNRTTARTSRGMQAGATNVTQTIRLARGDRVRLTVPVPVFGDSESIQFEIRERGRVIEQLGYIGLRSRALPHQASVLVVSEPDRALARVGRRRGGSTGSTAFALGRGSAIPVRSLPPPLDFTLEPARLPNNWVGFTSLRAVVIDPAGWEQLSDAQKTAIVSWIAAGGDLLLVDGNPDTLFPGLPQTPADAPVRIHFFGRVHRTTLVSLEGGLEKVLLASETARDGRWALPANGAPDWGAIAGRGFRLMIPGIEGVPARTYLTILILFGVLIGPVNYWWLRRRRQQVLIVLTVPLISAVFIALLAGYALAGEGFGVHGRAVSLTLLDQASRQAVTRTATSLYAAGLTPSGGLRFSRDVAVYPIGFDGIGARGRIRLDLSDAQRFSSGLLEARSPTNLEVVSVRAARERLSFSQDSGGIAVVNGLDATVMALVYREGDAKYGLARALAPGAKDVLKAASAAELSISAVIPRDAPMESKLLHLLMNQPSGSYLAVLDCSPFWESGVSRLNERGSLHLVLGWPERPASPNGLGAPGPR